MSESASPTSATAARSSASAFFVAVDDSIREFMGSTVHVLEEALALGVLLIWWAATNPSPTPTMSQRMFFMVAP
jgi:hypothetical protein